jgi:YidC/Oxa1 family membrane protein insertase
MDKKNTIIGLLLLGCAIALMLYNEKVTREKYEQSLEAQAAQQIANAESEPTTPSVTTVPQITELLASAKSGDSLPVAVKSVSEALESRAPEALYYLDNDFIHVEFTNWGGAIKTVAFKDYPETRDAADPYLFNAHHAAPALALGYASDADKFREYAPVYSLERIDNTSIEFRRVESNGLAIIRRYEITLDPEGAQPYTIRHSTRLLNVSDQVLDINKLYISIGTAAPDEADLNGWYLNAGWYDGEDYDDETMSALQGSDGFMGFGRSDPKPYIYKSGSLTWASVKNQFFTAILTPEKKGVGIYLQAVDFPQKSETTKTPQGIFASMEFKIPTLQPNAEYGMNLAYYAGPKEYPRLSKLDQNQDLVMQFGWFGFFSKLLLYILMAFHSLFNNWGMAIILSTVFIRLLMWPLTAKASKSAKQMAKLAEPMKEIREKYKDNPQKLQKETLKLYQEYKINPLAGCLPIFIQMPIFIAYYYMLRSASELRFAPFLWIPDLSMPDTIMHIASFPLNVMPILYLISMVFQMKLTPTPSMDATQAKFMRLMPVFFMFIMYNFSSGLFLYWTTSNLMSIIQQVLTNRKPDEASISDPKVIDVKAEKMPRKPLKS